MSGLRLLLVLCAALLGNAATIRYINYHPASLALHEFESDGFIFAFQEQRDFLLPADVQVDLSSDGAYYHEDQYTPGVVRAGSLTSVYLLHYDPVGYLEVPGLNYRITLSFPGRRVAGVVLTDRLLSSSDWLTSLAATTLPALSDFRYRGLELGELDPALSDGMESDYTMAPWDSVFISGGTITIDGYAGPFLDEVRLLLVPGEIPEPSVWVLVGCGLCGLALFRRYA